MGNAQSNTTDGLEQLFDRQIQREIVLAEQLFNEREALSLARQRNSVVWELFTTGTVTIAALYYGIKTKNKFAMVPIIPLVMFTGYHYEKCGDKFIEVVRKDANRILADPKKLAMIKPVGGPITLKELDERRMRWKDKMSA